MGALQVAGIVSLGSVAFLSLIYGEIKVLTKWVRLNRQTKLEKERGFKTSLFLYFYVFLTNVSELTQTLLHTIELRISLML